jgi:hypothetical protein
MYRALVSFATNDYDVRRKQLLEDNFTTQDEITEFLDIGYIEVYDGTIEITENGQYSVEDYDIADVNVEGGSGDKNAKTISTVTVSGSATGVNALQLSLLIELPELTLSGVTALDRMFYGLTGLITFPNFTNSSTISSIKNICYGCTGLVNVPAQDWSSVTAIGSAFSNCPNLSNDSLNNIMASLITATGVSSTNKRLSTLGLSSDQITTCHSLSNYEAFTNAGWRD